MTRVDSYKAHNLPEGRVYFIETLDVDRGVWMMELDTSGQPLMYESKAFAEKIAAEIERSRAMFMREL
jgi:hypothetical protein